MGSYGICTALQTLRYIWCEWVQHFSIATAFLTKPSQWWVLNIHSFAWQPKWMSSKNVEYLSPPRAVRQRKFAKFRHGASGESTSVKKAYKIWYILYIKKSIIFLQGTNWIFSVFLWGHTFETFSCSYFWKIHFLFRLVFVYYELSGTVWSVYSTSLLLWVLLI